jgi:hypothetical protein
VGKRRFCTVQPVLGAAETHTTLRCRQTWKKRETGPAVHTQCLAGWDDKGVLDRSLRPRRRDWFSTKNPLMTVLPLAKTQYGSSPQRIAGDCTLHSLPIVLEPDNFGRLAQCCSVEVEGKGTTNGG